MKRKMRVALSICICACIGAFCAKGAEVSFGGEKGEDFLIDGKPVQIRAGELDPQRVPREYWRHRVRMCKAMGLNAISSYFMWNDFERPDGSFDFKSGSRDVAAFLALCRDEGMWVLFRPGPYICGEWDFGGLPSRLLKEDVAVRTMDTRYLAEAEKYLSAIADIAEPFLAKNGGPQYSIYCPAPFLRKGDNQIDIIELEDTKPNPICGLARPLVRAAAISTKNISNVW